MPGLNLRVPHIATEASGMTSPYPVGEAYRSAGYMRNEPTSGDDKSCSQFYLDSEDEDDTGSDATKADCTESKSDVQILREVYGTLTVAEQKLGEVIIRLEDSYTGTDTNSRESVREEIISYLRKIGLLAYPLSNCAHDVAACLLFKRNNPVYPIYPAYSASNVTHTLTRANLHPYLGPSPFSSSRSRPNQNLETDTNTFPIQSLREINFHDLRISEAKRFINHHLNICSTQSKLTRTEIICGWGKHSKHNPGGETLKKALKEYLDGRGVKCEEVPGNRGRLCVYLGDDIDNLDSSKHMREVDDEGTSTSVGNIGISTTCTSTPSNKPTPQSSYNSESESRFVVSSGSSIPMSLLLSSTEENIYETGLHRVS